MGACLPVLLLWAPWSAEVAAQICAGRQAFNAAPVQAAGGVRASSSMTAVNGRLGAGTNTLFGVLSGSRAVEEGLGGQYALGAVLGSDQPMTVDNRVHFCPVLGLGYGWREVGPPGGSGGMSARAALHVSRLAVNSPARVVAPTAAVELVWEPDASGRRETALIASGGVGVLFRNRVGLQAQFGLRVGTRRRDPQVAVEAGYGF